MKEADKKNDSPRELSIFLIAIKAILIEIWVQRGKAINFFMKNIKFHHGKAEKVN